MLSQIGGCLQISVDVEHQLTWISRTEDRYTHREANPTGCIVFILCKHNFVLARRFFGEKFYLLEHSIKLLLLILLPATPDLYAVCNCIFNFTVVCVLYAMALWKSGHFALQGIVFVV